MCSKKAAVLLYCLFFLEANHCRADRCSIEGGIRLAGFNSTLVGYVEICKNEIWLRLLTDTDSWTHKNSIVVCQQLGYLDALKLFDKSSVVQPARSSSTHMTYAANMECTGSEQTFNDCTRNPQHSHKGQQVNFVACREAPFSGDVRLVAISSSDSEGLVEMYFSHRAYRWSTLCTNGWDDVDAAIVCKQLGYNTGKSKYFSSWEVSIDQLPRQRYDNFKCSGTEIFLSQCSSDGPYPYKCYSEGYAGVTCQDYDDPNSLDVPPTAAFLVLVTGASLVVIVILALIVKCVTKLKKKTPPTTIEQSLNGSPHMHQRVNRVRLDPHSWNNTSAVTYLSLSNPAPPSYTDTIRTDEEAQHQISQETTTSLHNNIIEQINGQSSEESETNIET